MITTFSKLVVASAISLSLIACGGSDSDSSNNAENFIPPANVVVTGEFRHSAETGKYFATEEYPSYVQYGQNAKHCYQNYNDYYYETDKVMVFGNPGLPEDDFTQAAKWVESNFPSALAAFGLTEQEYFAARGNTRYDAIRFIRDMLKYNNAIDFPYPTDFDKWTEQAQEDWAYNTAQSLSYEEVDAILANNNYIGYLINDVGLEQKIYVCLHEQDNPYGWGEGSQIGITIGAKSVYKPSDIDQLIQHELIHTFQIAISGDIDGLKLPRWFSEGQAVYLSGMSVAKKEDHQEYNPTQVVTFWDEYGDPSDAYKHYGLAYQYLADANSANSIIEMLTEIGRLRIDWQVQNSASFPEIHNYVEAFDKHMKQQNGTPLTVEQYRNNYHGLMSSYAN